MHPSFTVTLDQLRGSRASAVIFSCIAGSRAYGTAGPASDTDIRGIYVAPAASYLSLAVLPEQVADERQNEVYYTLRRFFELAAKANPNMLELLFMPEDCVLRRTSCGDILYENREAFLSKLAYNSHVSYAMTQIKRARGQNKWVNKPMPEAPPGKESFCRFIPREVSLQDFALPPYRPKTLEEAGIKLHECHAAAVEHTENLYRLYHYGTTGRGVFRGENLVCEPIPREDEAARCIGLLVYNKAAYEQSMRDHHNYWIWRQNRNDDRWITQERGEIDYDAKNLMHTFRLLLCIEHLFREGTPRVRFGGAELDFLLQVRAGRFAYDELIFRAEEKVAALEELRDESPLPETPDLAALDALLSRITTKWEAEYA